MSSPVIAHATLKAIEDAINVDGGARFRTLLRPLMPLAEDAYRGEDSPFRKHLGASLIGRECAREAWYGFRWASKPSFPARILRLFNRGHLEEPRMVALMQLIGCTVWQFDAEGKQYKIADHNGHFGGSIDCALQGIPEFPLPTPILGEFKTHGDKSFVKLAGKNWRAHRSNPTKQPFDGEGVRKTKFEHYVQMQLYMGKMGLPWALYLAVNKNDDELYAELVEYDLAICEAFTRRAADVIRAIDPPAKISNDPAWFTCKMCNRNDICHRKATPARNCRTCFHSSPGQNGDWICDHDEQIATTLDEAAQLRGCNLYELMPSLKR